MDWILNGIFKTFIGWITSVLDIYFSAILGALGVNLSVFESVFPLVKKLSIGIMAIALGVAFYIFIFQISKNLNPSSIDEAESPLSLLASFATAIFSVLAYKPLLNILLSFTTSSLTVLQSSKLTKILKKGLASDMFDSFYDALVKTSSSKSIVGKAIDSVKNTVGSVVGTHMPERIAAIILVAYIYSKLYKMTKIMLRTYVGVGILTYLAPLPLACLSSRATKGVTKGFLQIYIEHLLSIILNCWFLRIVLDGFGAINFDSLSKMQSSMSGIQKIISDIMTSPVEKKFTTFAVIVVWSMMIGAFIDYAVTINIYIERMTGVGGLSIVPNGQSINPFKDNVVTKAATGAAAAVGGLAGSIAGTPLKSMKNMAGKAWEEKLKSEVQSTKEGNGFFGFGGSGINPTNPSPGPNDGNPNNGNPNNGSGGAAMGGSKPLKQNAIDGEKSMEPFSPAVENAKQAGMYSLLHKPLSGKNAKKQMAAAMKDKNGFMDPYGEGKEYLDKLKNGKSKEDQNKLDNSLVFDAGKDGMQIMSDIESDGKGKITATMNGENIELFNDDAQGSATESGNLDASVDIGGQTMSYDSSKCPTFHKMMGGITFDESEIVSSEASNSGSMGTVDNSTSSGTYTSSETVFGGASNDVLGNESVGGFGSGSNHAHSKSSLDDINSRIYNPGSSQTYDDFTVGNNNASSSGGPLESSKSGPKPSSDDKDVNTDQSDIEF